MSIVSPFYGLSVHKKTTPAHQLAVPYHQRGHTLSASDIGKSQREATEDLNIPKNNFFFEPFDRLIIVGMLNLIDGSRCDLGGKKLTSFSVDMRFSWVNNRFECDVCCWGNLAVNCETVKP